MLSDLEGGERPLIGGGLIQRAVEDLPAAIAIVAKRRAGQRHVLIGAVEARGRIARQGPRLPQRRTIHVSPIVPVPRSIHRRRSAGFIQAIPGRCTASGYYGSTECQIKW